jgi:1-acyl-sn-glycerol-3-phosphate acyltransferase
VYYLKKLKGLFILVEFIITVTVVIIFFYLFKNSHWQIRKTWAKIQKWLIGYKLEIEGKPDLDAGIIILNHQSLLDIILVEATYPKNVSWVAKKEIAQMKFFGRVITMPKMVALDREDKKSLIKLFSDCKDRVSEGRVIAIFPEGTRGDGKKIAKFKAGSKLIASKLKLKVQPAVIVNTRNVLDSQKFLAKSGKVKLIYLDSIDISQNKNWFDDIQVAMQERLDLENSLLSNQA